MKLQTLATKSMFGIVSGAKIFLKTTSPLQKFVDRPGYTHEFCNNQAITILQRDGFIRCAEFFLKYSKELNSGVLWADQDWKNIGHYYDPKSTRGLWHFPSADEEFQHYINQAMANKRQGNLSKTVFFLGAAAHLLQDLCVPHHSRRKIFSGHQQYEKWVQQYCNNYAINSHGIYQEGKPLGEILLENASVSADLLNWVETDKNKVLYHRATEILLPLAQGTTAGFLQQVYNILFQAVTYPQSAVNAS